MNFASLTDPFRQAVDYHLSGDIASAQRSYESLLKELSFLPTLRANLGGIYIQQGRFNEALILLDLALAEEPYHKEALTNKSLALEKLGRKDDSISTLETLLEHTTGVVQTYLNLSDHYFRRHRTDDSLEILDTGLECYPGDEDLLRRRVFRTDKIFDRTQVLKYVDAQIEKDSRLSPLLNSILSSLYLSTGDLSSALKYITLSIAENPNVSSQVAIDKASILFRLGKHADNIEWINANLERYPKSVSLINLKAQSLHSIGQIDNAILLYQISLSINPSDPNTLFLSGSTYIDKGQYKLASSAISRSIELNPLSYRAHVAYAQCMFFSGDIIAAHQYYKSATTLRPTCLDAWDLYLYFLSFTNLVSSADIQSAARTYFSEAIDPLIHDVKPFSPPSRKKRSRKRIRLGVVSAEVGAHCVSYFLLSLLKGAKSNNLDIFLFPSKNRSHEDRWDLMKSLSHTFLPIYDLDDATACKLIRDQKLDVVLETTQHMTSNRLPLMARRLAPVQCHYIGMHGTTGIPQIDYFIGDSIVTPPSFSKSFTEKFLCLDRSWVCYSPPTILPKLDPPLSETTPISFGCFNNTTKISQHTLDLWVQVLQSFNDSILYLKDSLKLRTDRQTDIQDYLCNHGIKSHRIKILGRTSSWDDHMYLYNKFDVSLDTTPLTSGTTAFDSLLMGTPLMVYSSDWIGGRLSHSIVNSVYGSNWIATTADDYINNLHLNLADLMSFRASVHERRQAFLSSQLCDFNSLSSSIYRSLLSVVK